MNEEGLNRTHERFAITSFNQCWELISLPRRTQSQTEMMIRLAETSYWHWCHVKHKTDNNISIGLWQLSRVYSLAGNQSQALEFGNQCLEMTTKSELPPFLIAYAFEAIARALKEKGEDYQDELRNAFQFADQVAIEDSKKALLADLESIE